MGKLNGLPIPGSNPVSDSNDQILEVFTTLIVSKIIFTNITEQPFYKNLPSKKFETDALKRSCLIGKNRDLHVG